MKENIMYVCLLLISTFLIFIVNNYIKKIKTNSQLKEIFSINFSLIVLWQISLIFQICFSKYIKPIYFDYIAYIGICFLPVSLLFTGKIFARTKISFSKKDLLLLIVPLTSVIILWTNDLHHLFYINYSINFKDAVFGKYFMIHTVYSYVCIAFGLVYLIFYSVKNSGFFSKQSILIFTGTLTSLLINAVATFGILDLSIYITPISFTIAVLFIAIAIFKFDFLKVAPIALQRIVDRISDAYIVVNEENVVTDFNKTFLDLFNVTGFDIRNKSLEELFDKYNDDLKIDKDLILRSNIKCKIKTRYNCFRRTASFNW